MKWFLFFLVPYFLFASIQVGVGKTDITPPIGTPSAGYAERKGSGMEGVHDPLLAMALFIDNGEKQIALCSVDHLGFTYKMVQAVSQKVHEKLPHCEIYISSSHTHAGGGAFLDIPMVGPMLAGPYSAEITASYIEKTAEAILSASANTTLARVGIGYGKAGLLSQYRAQYPKDITPLSDVTIIKVTDENNVPLAAFFNYPVHPTVLNGKNKLFSADFVGFARNELQSELGVEAIYANGAQGDINPIIFNETDRFESCNILGVGLAKTVKQIWDTIETSDTLEIQTQKESYTFTPEANPFGLVLPVNTYDTEINLLVLNQKHAFITVPGELSCIYDKKVKLAAQEMGYFQLSILGLTNDAHGYIITPESWENKTAESQLSFGGKLYGEMTEKMILKLLRMHSL